VPEFKAVKCRGAQCGAPVFWATTTRGKAMPVDAEPADDGNVLITGDPERPQATVVNPDQPPLGGWSGPLYTSHFRTCPDAGNFRKPKGGTR
jgi:hypothetical protein